MDVLGGLVRRLGKRHRPTHGMQERQQVYPDGEYRIWDFRHREHGHGHARPV